MGNSDAACLTCRQKSRRCDRARPMCKRCVSKGLQCAGYPEKFRFCGIASRGKWKNHEAPVTKDSASGAAAESPTPTGKKTQARRAKPTRGRPRTSDRVEKPSPISNSPLNVASQGNSPNAQSEINQVLASKEAEKLLTHYDRVICPHQIAQSVDSGENPYRLYVLPLAYEQFSLLYAVLALAACHLGHLSSDKHLIESVSVEYRAKAINALAIVIQKVCSGTFSGSDRDAVFATIQILLLHDICETGVSTHGAHISGAMSICSQLKIERRLTVDHERTVFFLGNLVWLDIIRAFSLPERLCFTQELRSKLLSLCNLRFEAVNGCPREIVLVIGEILELAKARAGARVGENEFHNTTSDAIRKLYLWDSSRCFFPDDNTLWVSVANAFRFACILRAWRLLDPLQPASDPRIKECVFEILDSVANIPKTSPLIELMVLPLFMAGADSLSAHSRHYVLLRLDEIKARSEMGNTAPRILLEKVWHARAQQPKNDLTNIPWMMFASNTDSVHQDDYLII
ncbi:fungal-specific transcription factor domain-containing protein [Penicillium argentinense]|uniref:Fungal-specific transcription factor domain-containing protein n=1 Tax=Penicillium argentinense TaxID=1131581 RepID=A0A9W9JV04_9EURO|nr:fungal-specific transcription factor domain-containing protein [Penicillium argentinense]KAJ5082142.1 fungal-specific transcription factor domain-containing protein [Penicillium argentinense]